MYASSGRFLLFFVGFRLKFKSVADGFLRTDINTFPALDAFPVTDFLYIHPAFMHTGIAVRAFAGIHPYPEKSYGIKEGIKGSKRTDKPAESPVAKYTQQQYQYEQAALPGKEKACHLP